LRPKKKPTKILHCTSRENRIHYNGLYEISTRKTISPNLREVHEIGYLAVYSGWTGNKAEPERPSKELAI
jgi:hypothetical protein